eukprot:TRINITY_DN13508_c0_g1_i1.p1 TRINITY_DN13508_c0_g1~~TRINITY_DN13508_c0_g1_i1.p1  ORF type:complete len:666 (-),score=105.01 TRINITY_DN13508_c0_g1_i1:249-2246(-)
MTTPLLDTLIRSGPGASALSGSGGECPVQVFTRVRPFGPHEKRGGPPVIAMVPTTTTIIEPGTKKENTFHFDRCFWSCEPGPDFSSQAEVYAVVGKRLVESLTEGFNACLLAYGQTGSGKTYSMMGEISSPDGMGITPRLCEELFAIIAANTESGIDYHVEVNYLELYNEKVRDLLVPGNQATPKELRVRQHPVSGPFVEGLLQVPAPSTAQILALLRQGSANRTVSSTLMNDQSSRSHSVFTIVLSQRQMVGECPITKSSKLRLVDLAGSERSSRTGVEVGGKQFKEMTTINLSLSTLARVIDALVLSSTRDKPVKPPYRDSVLTWLLSDSLGGNSKTSMLATVSPDASNYSESLSTLRYASGARRITTKPVVNEDPTAKLIRELQLEVESLRAQLTAQGLGSARFDPAASGGGSEPEGYVNEQGEWVYRAQATASQGPTLLQTKMMLSSGLIQELQEQLNREQKAWEIRDMERQIELSQNDEVRNQLEMKVSELSDQLEEARHEEERRMAEVATLQEQLLEREQAMEEEIQRKGTMLLETALSSAIEVEQAAEKVESLNHLVEALTAAFRAKLSEGLETSPEWRAQCKTLQELCKYLESFQYQPQKIYKRRRNGRLVDAKVLYSSARPFCAPGRIGWTDLCPPEVKRGERSFETRFARNKRKV